MCYKNITVEDDKKDMVSAKQHAVWEDKEMCDRLLLSDNVSYDYSFDLLSPSADIELCAYTYKHWTNIRLIWNR